MSSSTGIAAWRHGLSLGWQVAIVVAMGLITSSASTTAVYFGLRGSIETEVRRNDEQDKELERKAERSDVEALKTADAMLAARIERERADVKEVLAEMKQQLREMNASLKQIADDAHRK